MISILGQMLDYLQVVTQPGGRKFAVLGIMSLQVGVFVKVDHRLHCYLEQFLNILSH
jgi:hypothetical protein